MAGIDALRFHAALSQVATRVEDLLDRLLPPPEMPVTEAMRYAVLSGGKRLRAFLVAETATMFRVPVAMSDRVAAAVECLHAYSLVHDDLPAMDNDDLRRGKPTVHVKWDEATAILAGDALQTLAFEILTAPQTSPDANVRLKLIEGLARASGARGMVGGQALDIAAEKADVSLDLDAITRLQGLKTGALITWSVEAGAILGRSDATALRKYAADLGLAFQIQDDILDETGDEAAAGKRLRKDARANKATFVSLLGLEEARRRAQALADSACEALAPYGSAAANLRLAADYIVSRTA
jgi:farnesyl diphosphate synthase